MSGQFECTPCLVKELTPGVQWSEPPGNKGELMINTCPIDNVLTGLTIFTNEQNADLQGMLDKLKAQLAESQKKAGGAQVPAKNPPAVPAQNP